METKKKRKSWSHLNTIDDFNKFIEENDIRCTKDLYRKFSSGYVRASKLNLLDKLIYPERKNNWNYLNTLDDFNKFIEENDIKNPSDFEKRFGGGYVRGSKLNLLDKLIYPERRNNLDHINTSDDFNKFIVENDIKNPSDFEKRFNSVYRKAHRLGILDKLIYPERQNDWNHLSTLDDFNKFIVENDIKNPRNLQKRFGGVYGKTHKLNLLDKLIYPERRNNWDHLNTLDDFNKFIVENNIKDPKNLRKKFGSVYVKASKLRILGDLIYCKGKREKSSWEVDIYNIITNIPEFINPKREVTFKDCKNKRELPFDIVFSLPNGKIIIIEIQGPRHYTQIFGEKEYIPTRKNDLIKYRWTKGQNNINLFYFSKPNRHLDENSYFHYVYTSEEELINDIKKLI